MGKQFKAKKQNVFKVSRNSRKINKEKNSCSKKKNYQQQNKVEQLNAKFKEINQLVSKQLYNKNVMAVKSTKPVPKITLSEDEIQSTLNLMKRL